MQGLPDQCVGHVGSVVLRRVDVVDTKVDGTPQHGHRLVVIAGRTEHSRARELHRAEADAIDGVGTERGARHDPLFPRIVCTGDKQIRKLTFIDAIPKSASGQDPA